MSKPQVENTATAIQRFTELRSGPNGRLQADWHLSDTHLGDPVKITFPPVHAIPIIFVPGIMGSNLCDLTNKPVWLLNSIKDVPASLAWNWSTKNAAERQAILHPDRTKVYGGGAVPADGASPGLNRTDYLKRGWGEVSQASYHKFLLWLDNKMNGDRNPANWDDFTYSSLVPSGKAVREKTRNPPPGLVMNMNLLPRLAESGFAVESVRSDELLKRAKFTYPIYAFGYNWLASNSEAAESLKMRIEKIIAENNLGVFKCAQVILVTHSMGGLVARACSGLPEMSRKILGVVHGVMPATGAAVAYRRCKVGMKDEDAAAGLVIGSDGQEVTAVFAQSPGALQLLPSEDYGPGWMSVSDTSGRSIASLPVSDPYQEIYLTKDKWWGLIREEWLAPRNGAPLDWKDYEINIKQARDFHRELAQKYHDRTYVFYGGGAATSSFSKISWKMTKGISPATDEAVPTVGEMMNLSCRDVRSDGSNNLYVGGKKSFYTSSRGDSPMLHVTETSHWEIRCALQDSPGDGTVPVRSGQAPRRGGGKNILQQFELDGIQHEPAYRDYPIARQVAYYAITKLSALADIE